MLQSWAVLLTTLVYTGILFAVAHFGDAKKRAAEKDESSGSRPYIYAFSLAIYCTTWTIFGSVGFAVSSGINFVAIYLGPILMITLGFPLFQRVLHLSKSQRITSVADFIGARYGKSAIVGGVAAFIAVIGTVPYIALQLKAISNSVSTLLTHYSGSSQPIGLGLDDVTLTIALVLAVFAILFGTRHADATEHQHGMMLAVAMESVVKLGAFLAVGIFVTYSIFDGFGDLFAKAQEQKIIETYVSRGFDGANFLILLVLSSLVFLLLPRQFHVAVVENKSAEELKKARWLFPLYLIAINLFVIPIALAGLITFGDQVPADSFVLALPMSQGSEINSLLAFLGGLSAGTAMVIVACVALAIMVSNHIVLPLFLRQRTDFGKSGPRNMEQLILNIRRTTIFILLIAAYFYYQAADNSAELVSIGLVSFAAISQLAPVFFGGLFWRRANARGAITGMLTGFSIWGYTLLLPTLLSADHPLMHDGLFGLALLRPEQLFYLNLSPLGNGVFCSLLFNIIGLIVGSLTRKSNGLEHIQSTIFVQSGHRPLTIATLEGSNVQVGELMDTVAQYLGEKRTARSFDAYQKKLPYRILPTDTSNAEILQYSEQLLASAIGASSSRLVHRLLIKRFDNASLSELKLLDDASQALRFNRGVLQTALDQIEQGICVFDADYRLSSWNRQFREMLNLPASVGTAGTSLSVIIREIVEGNNLEHIGLDEEAFTRHLVDQKQSWQFELPIEGQIIDVRSASMPEGGLVLTWQDNTDRVLSAKALRDANVMLEKRVAERTTELTGLNKQLEQATKVADQANQEKTRFLAAAGHDILQPLNAARLYASTLIERLENEKNQEFAASVNQSLDSVEEILGAVLAISHLDASTEEIKLSTVSINRIFDQLKIEFRPIAEKENLELVFVQTSLMTRSDPSLLIRLLRNLISNALKYTREGKVLVGCRRKQGQVSIDVFDTGIGIADEDQPAVFKEFKRLRSGISTPGLGLGLSIVERISRRLGHGVTMKSKPGQGTHVAIQLIQIIGKLPENEPVKLAKPIAGNIKPGLKVLCVDNDPLVLNGLTSLLEQWQCKVLTAHSSREALGLIRDLGDTPQMILMDYHLDEETGIDAISTIRSQTRQDLPAVLVTAERSRELRLDADRLGLTFLNKPVKPAALRSVLAVTQKYLDAAE